VYRPERADNRIAVMMAVLLIHAIVGAVLIRTSRAPLLFDLSAQPIAIELLPELSRIQPKKSSSGTVHLPVAGDGGRMKPAQPDLAAETAPKSDDIPPEPVKDATVPSVDWDHEVAIAAQNRVNASESEKLYRNLAGFSAAQLEWMKRNRMEPVPYNPFWGDGRHENSPGVLWINDDCAIVSLLPVCRIKLGRRKARGDLFKDMRKYLDERVTDPLP
jgi:hypothetical protein